MKDEEKKQIDKAFGEYYGHAAKCVTCGNWGAESRLCETGQRLHDTYAKLRKAAVKKFKVENPCT